MIPRKRMTNKETANPSVIINPLIKLAKRPILLDAQFAEVGGKGAYFDYEDQVERGEFCTQTILIDRVAHVPEAQAEAIKENLLSLRFPSEWGGMKTMIASDGREYTYHVGLAIACNRVTQFVISPMGKGYPFLIGINEGPASTCNAAHLWAQRATLMNHRSTGADSGPSLAQLYNMESSYKPRTRDAVRLPGESAREILQLLEDLSAESERVKQGDRLASPELSLCEMGDKAKEILSSINAGGRI